MFYRPKGTVSVQQQLLKNSFKENPPRPISLSWKYCWDQVCSEGPLPGMEMENESGEILLVFHIKDTQRIKLITVGCKSSLEKH